jgi:hypothetical protein
MSHGTALFAQQRLRLLVNLYTVDSVRRTIAPRCDFGHIYVGRQDDSVHFSGTSL